jgi:hypothetical protein
MRGTGESSVRGYESITELYACTLSDSVSKFYKEICRDRETTKVRETRNENRAVRDFARRAHVRWQGLQSLDK